MNQQERFDELTRELASASVSRSRMLRLLGGAVLGSALGGWGLALGAGDAEARRRKKKKRLPTVKSLRAARAQIEAGATDVALSPGGYFRYRRTFSGTLVTSEELLEEGKPVLTWEHTIGLGSISKGYGDADRDGFAESRITTSRGKGGVTSESMTIEDYSPQTQALIRRQTYTRTGTDTIHVLRERDDGSGNLVKEAEFDTTPIQVLTSEHLAGSSQQAQAQFAPLSGSGCTAAQEKDIRDRLDEAMVQGFTCMRKNGFPELGNKVVSLTGRKVIINCESDPDSKFVAKLHWWDATVGSKELEITVNLSEYDQYTAETQRALMWHETTHAHFGSHDFFPKPRHFEIDQGYACQMLCFPGSMKSEYRTKCACARCLGTDKCDKRCKGFDEACDSDMGSGISVESKEECNGKCMDPCPAGKERDLGSCQCVTTKCNPPCKVGETCCEHIGVNGFFQCVDTKTDIYNCGGCNSFCPEYGVCNNGSCECTGVKDKYCPDTTNSTLTKGSCCISGHCCGHMGGCVYVPSYEDCHTYHECASC